MSPVEAAPSLLDRSSTRPVQTWPYVAICLLLNTILFASAVLARLRWGMAAVPAAGLVISFASIVIAAWLFYRRHNRRFFRTERRYFSFGCVLVHWIYEDTLRLALRLTHRAAQSTEDVVVAFGAFLVGFILVWVFVRCVDWVAALKFSQRHGDVAA